MTQLLTMTSLLTKRQAAEILQQSIPTLDRKIREGKLKVKRLGRAVRIEPEDLQAYIDGGESREKPVGETTGTHCSAGEITIAHPLTVSRRND